MVAIIEDSLGREIAKEESEDVGSSGGEEETAEAKFSDLKSADDENYAAVVQGAMTNILLGFELNEEERKEEDSRIARRQALRRKAKRKATASSQEKRRKVNARLFESDDEDAAAEFEKSDKVAKRPQHGPRAKTTAKKSAGDAEAAALDGQQEARTPDSKAGRGAPKKSVDEVAAQHWNEFAKADKHSLFFSDVAEVKRRLLVRWGNSARAQATSARDPEKRRSLESCTKRFQIMEECIKMHRAWVARSGNTTKAAAEFTSSWDVLEAFAASAPAERIRSDFMQNFVLEFKVDCSFLIRRSRAEPSSGLLLSNSPKPMVHSFADPSSSHDNRAQATQVTNPQAIDPQARRYSEIHMPSSNFQKPHFEKLQTRVSPSELKNRRLLHQS